MNEPKQTPFLSVVIPAYDEELRIGKTLISVYDYLIQQSYSWELLIVLDGVEDNTLERVKAFAQGKKEIRWIDRQENRGKGYTVREGMLAAHGQVRLFTDADNSTNIRHFEKMQPLLHSGHDVVICSRDAKDVEGAQQIISQPLFKRLLGDLGNLFIQFVAVPGIWDTQCGFKAFSQEAAEKIFPLTQIERWGFDAEVLALARYFGYRIGIVPAYWRAEAGSHVKFTDYFATLLEAIKVRLNLFLGVYNRNSTIMAGCKRAWDGE